MAAVLANNALDLLKSLIKRCPVNSLKLDQVRGCHLTVDWNQQSGGMVFTVATEHPFADNQVHIDFDQTRLEDIGMGVLVGLGMAHANVARLDLLLTYDEIITATVTHFVTENQKPKIISAIEKTCP